MEHVLSLSHTKRECTYHVVWIPKYRKKSLYVELRKYVGSTFKDLAMQKACQVIEGHLLPDHIHLLISIPLKYSVSQAIGYLKGKSAIHIARTYMGRKKNFTGQYFWARGYYVSTVGHDEATIRAYIRNQEQEDQRLDQLNMFQE